MNIIKEITKEINKNIEENKDKGNIIAATIYLHYEADQISCLCDNCSENVLYVQDEELIERGRRG